MSRIRSERGAVAVLVAVMAVALFVLAALVVDLGFARDTKARSQNTADAAALAAANVLYGDGTRPRFGLAEQAAKKYASDILGIKETDWRSCTDSNALRHRPADTPCISFQSSVSSTFDVTKPDTVRVRIPTQTVNTAFGAVAGVSTVPVSTRAEASLRLATLPTCALCVLGPGPHNLQNGEVDVSGGNIYFNGSVNMQSNGNVTTTDKTYIQGSATGGNYSPAPLTGQPAQTDPLAFMPMPDATSVPIRSNPCTDGPGRYESYRFSSACVLSPGLYVIAGSSSVWDTQGQASVVANGVTLYFTCGTKVTPVACSPSVVDGASLNMAGATQFVIKAPDSGDLKGLAILYDRNNDSVLRAVGTSGAQVQGTIYALSATLQMNGAGCTAAMNSMIVVKSVAIVGNPACLKSSYALSQNVDMPPDSLRLSR